MIAPPGAARYRWLFPTMLITACVASNLGGGLGAYIIGALLFGFVFNGVFQHVLRPSWCPRPPLPAREEGDVERFLGPAPAAPPPPPPPAPLTLTT